jgi:hypothetical protein
MAGDDHPMGRPHRDATVQIWTTQGGVHRKYVPGVEPLTSASEVRAKFRGTAGQVLSHDRVERIQDFVSALDELESLEPLLVELREPEDGEHEHA